MEILLCTILSSNTIMANLHILKKQNNFDRSPNFLMVGDQLLDRRDCDKIINHHLALPFEDIWENVDGIGGKVAAKNERAMDSTWKYESDFKEFTVLHPDQQPFDECMEIVTPYLPKNEDYDGVNYAQIIRYKEDAMFQWHKDVADGNDTATAIFFLNDEYEGGRLNVEGHLIQPRLGTMVTFNNSTERWHSVEPIYKGERWVLAIWFGRYHETTIESIDGADDESEQYAEMQSVSDTNRSDES